MTRTPRRGPGASVSAEDFKAAEPFLVLEDQPRSVRLWRKHLKGITPQMMVATMRADMPRGLRMTIAIDDAGEVTWESVIDRSGGRSYDKLLYAKRTIDANGVLIEHNKMQVSKRAQGNGIGRVFLANSMQLYKALGLKKISVTAAMTAGGYVWARFGFVPEQAEWDKLRRDIKEDLRNQTISLPPDHLDVCMQILRSRNPKAIWLLSDLRYKVDGKPLGRVLLADRMWDGTFDMQDPAAMTRFYAYTRSEPKVAARPAPPPAPPAVPPARKI